MKRNRGYRPRATLNKPRGYKADAALSDREIELIARRIRTTIAPDIPDDQALPGVELFERLDEFEVPVPGMDRRIPLDWDIVSLPRYVEAQTRYDEVDDKIIIEVSESTYNRLKRGERRARSTLFHEIAHAFVHVDLLIRMSHIPHHEMALEMALMRVIDATHDREWDTEVQANAVAATLLMPARGLATMERASHVLGGYEVQARFKVSAESARIRIQTYERRRAQLI